MGFSLVAAFGIISVSVLIAFEIFTGSVLPSITDTHESFQNLIDRGSDKIQTDINITNVVVTPDGLNYDHLITVENTGSITLDTSDFVILLEGVLQSFSCAESYLYPMQTVDFTLEDIPGSGTKQLKIITDNGIGEYYEYSIE